MKQLHVAVSLIALAAAPAWAESSKSTADSGFIEKVARDGQAEVQLGQLAQQKAASSAVKSLAQRLITDHGQANQQLMSIAQRDGVSALMAADKEHSALLSKLQKLNGPEFDRAFMRAQIDDHTKEIQYFKKEEDAVKDPQLKSFIQQTLPVMQQHLQMAQQIGRELPASGSTSPPANR
jgi:putative membrane protein